jgi:hypothetical protein
MQKHISFLFEPYWLSYIIYWSDAALIIESEKMQTSILKF